MESRKALLPEGGVELFRVFPWVRNAEADQPGGGLYVPPQGAGRIDNPSAYAVLYVADSAAGAIAEAFGRIPEWSSAMLTGSPSLPGSVRALARYVLSAVVPVCNLDDPAQLIKLGLRPSEAVTRNYARSQAWARGIHAQRQWAGVRWWSYYDSERSSFGLWDIGRLSLAEVMPLRVGDSALREAARTIVRRVDVVE